MNSVTLFGNLGSDPELRHTQSGTAVLNLRLATNERRKDGDQWVDHTEWHTVVVWGKRGEALGRILRKGDKVLVAGALRTREYQKRDGTKAWSTEVHAHDVELSGKPSGAAPQHSSRTAPADDFAEASDDDIPF